MIRRPPRSTLDRSSAASDVYKRQPLAQVREIRPSLGAQHGTLPQLRHAEQAITEGDNVQRADPTRAIGFYLSGVRSATSELRKDPNDRVALHDYDFALSRVFSVIHDAHLDPWTRPLHIPAPNGGQYLSLIHISE